MKKHILISIDEAATYLGLQKSTLYSWINQRKIPYIKVGKLIKFDMRQLDKWLQEKACN